MQVINYLYQEFVHVTTRGNVDQTREAILINLNVRQKKKRKGQTHLRLLQYYINIDNWRETRRENTWRARRVDWRFPGEGFSIRVEGTTAFLRLLTSNTILLSLGRRRRQASI
jgi:hypothetical protein